MNRLVAFGKLIKYRKEIPPVLRNYFFLRNHQDQNFLGSISAEDEMGLKAAVTAAEAHPGPIVEIGTLFGFTTQALALMKAPERRLITVDNFSWNPFAMPAASHRVFARRALRYCIEKCNTEIFDGTSEQFFRSYRGSTPAMVFIDAEHTYEAVKAEIGWAMQARIPVICGHDYHPIHPGVVRAVDEGFGKELAVTGSVWRWTGSR